MGSPVMNRSAAMKYASVMVYVDDHAIGEARVALAIEIAAHFDGRVLGIAGSPVGSPSAEPYAAGAMVGEMATLFQDMAEADVKKAEAAFWQAVGPRTGRFEWRGLPGQPCDV